MSIILLSPHSDDAVLFASFIILKHQPVRVITVLCSERQKKLGITQRQRETEDVQAMGMLGVTLFQQWPETDHNPDWEAVGRMIAELDYESAEYVDRVFAPAVEDEGHDDHNMVGQLARDVFGDRVSFYLTYTRSKGRSAWGREVLPEPWMIPYKLRALACYETQMRPETGCQTWFLDGIREWVT